MIVDSRHLLPDRKLLPGGEWRSGPAAVRRPLEERIRGDYDEDRSLEVDGWILAATEVRILAYRALADAAG